MKTLSQVAQQVTHSDPAEIMLVHLLNTGVIGQRKEQPKVPAQPRNLREAYIQVYNELPLTEKNTKKNRDLKEIIKDYTFSTEDLQALNNLIPDHKHRILKLIHTTQIKDPIKEILKHTKIKKNQKNFLGSNESKIMQILELSTMSLDDTAYCLNKIQKAYETNDSLINIDKLTAENQNQSLALTEIFNGDEKLTALFFAMENLGKNYKKAGAFEWALIFMSPAIESAEKGDVEINGEKFEIKADSGRLAAGDVQTRDSIIKAIESNFQKATDNPDWKYIDLEKKSKSLSYYIFLKEIVANIPTEEGKRKIVKDVFDLILGSPYSDIISSSISTNLNPQSTDEEIKDILITIAGEVFSKYQETEKWEGLIVINSIKKRIITVYTKDRLKSLLKNGTLYTTLSRYGSAVISSSSSQQEHWLQLVVN
jgi:hypothetical protein